MLQKLCTDLAIGGGGKQGIMMIPCFPSTHPQHGLTVSKMKAQECNIKKESWDMIMEASVGLVMLQIMARLCDILLDENFKFSAPTSGPPSLLARPSAFEDFPSPRYIEVFLTG